ncbi:hypothetical protein EQG49_12680 [Periweissella cryptocerci]|uniref:Uncharacterized protein n=1 Tax=Periweissella cryptocerci TaxID=2506420 RepID=A0A4P6YWT9_9LACO|nr:hypothetical protein [Periweissella cryptocerci]QBO37253.1 hypothetical protein EQG49_12680 [Periweissella cryptocerci]
MTKGENSNPEVLKQLRYINKQLKHQNHLLAQIVKDTSSAHGMPDSSQTIAQNMGLAGQKHEA